MYGVDLASLEVDVGESVEFIDNDIDIVGAYTVAQAHDGLALIGASYGVKFARRNFERAGVEKVGNDIDAGGVAYEYDAVGEHLGSQVEVKHRAVGVYN